MSRDYPVTGLKDLMDYLTVLPANMQKNAIRQGLTAAARPVRDEARVLAAKRSGKMARAIKSGSPRQNQDGTYSIQIRLDPKSDHSYIGIFQEYGVHGHFIRAGDAGVSARILTRRARKGGMSEEGGHLKIGDRFITGAVHHPGHAAHPFMRPALDAKAEESIQAFAGKIRNYIENKTGFSPAIGGGEDD